jgi:hypothetical protein
MSVGEASGRTSGGGRSLGAADGSWSATLLFASVTIGIPLIAYWFLADRFGFVGPRINADLFLIYLLSVIAAGRSRRAGALIAIVGITATLSVQLLLGLGVIYIDDPALIYEYLSFARYWPWRLISFWLVVAAGALTIVYQLLRRVPIERARKLPVLLLLIALIATDMIGRTSAGHALLGGNLVTSGAVRGLKLVRSWMTSEGFRARPITPAMATELAFGTAPPRILSVAVEAYGWSKDDRYNRWVLARLQTAVKGRYQVEVALRGFKGATLSGELRELCAQRTSGTPTRKAAAELGQRCLPTKLAGAGYATLGIHGNPRFFYNRLEVYPAIGFQEVRFLEDFQKLPQKPAMCKTRAFEGVCDRDAIRYALEFLGGRPKAYAHVMSLDTHFPLGPTPLGNEDCGTGPLTGQPSLCLYANQMRNLLGQIGEELVAARQPPDLVYLFGDHAPPYAVAKERMFFDRDRVPVIKLRRIA